MRGLGAICAVVIGVAIGGCGDDDPEEQCKDLVEAVCSKVVECTDGLGDEAGDKIKEQCVSQSSKACEGAEEPKGDVDVDECIDAVNDASCGDFDAETLPNACGD